MKRVLSAALAHALLCALVLHLIVRTQGLVWGPLNIDETDFLTLTRDWLQGGLPYVSFFEKKPPLSYLFFVPGSLVWAMWPVQLLALVWALATCWVCGAAARAWTGSERDRSAAILLCALAQCAAIPAVNTETMLNLPSACALLAFALGARPPGGLSPERADARRLRFDLLAGLSVSIASLFRHQAGIVLLALGLCVAVELRLGREHPSQRLRALNFALLRILALAIGFLVPWALAALAWWRLGHLDDFLEWNLTRNFAYAGRSDLLGALWRFPGGLILGVLLAAPLAWALSVAETRRAWEQRTIAAPMRTLLVLLLWLTFIPVSLGGRFYDHYFLQFIPVVSVLAAPGLAALVARFDELSRKLHAAIAVALIVPLVFWLVVGVQRGLAHGFPEQDPRVREAGLWLREHSQPDDRVFVWGHYSPLYTLAQRLPGARAYVSTLIVGDFDPGQVPAGFDVRKGMKDRDLRLALEDLEARKPAFIVDTAPANIHEWALVPLSVAPEIEQVVRERYIEVARPGGLVVYRRR